MRTNEKNTEVRLCVLLTPQGICSLGSFLSHPAEMGRKERGGGHCIRGPPTPLRALLPAGAHGPWEHHGGKETQHSSQQSTGQSVESRSTVQS